MRDSGAIVTLVGVGALACSLPEHAEALPRESVDQPRPPSEMLETTAKRVTIERPRRNAEEVERRANRLADAMWASERQQPREWVDAEAFGSELRKFAGDLELEYEPDRDRLSVHNREARSTLRIGEVKRGTGLSEDEARAVAVRTLATVRAAGILDESWSDTPMRVGRMVTGSGHARDQTVLTYAFEFQSQLFGVPVLDSSFRVDVLANGRVASVELAAMTIRVEGDAAMVLSASQAREMFVTEARRTAFDPLWTDVELFDERFGYILPRGYDVAEVCPSLVASYVIGMPLSTDAKRAAPRPSVGVLSLCDPKPALSVIH